jgi:hypothetical protein
MGQAADAAGPIAIGIIPACRPSFGNKFRDWGLALAMVGSSNDFVNSSNTPGSVLSLSYLSAEFARLTVTQTGKDGKLAQMSLQTRPM